jgi:hypothetical protein
MKKIIITLIVISFVSQAAILAQTINAELVFTSKGEINYELEQDEKDFLDSLQYYSFLFFMNEINPELGIVKDRTAEWSAASIASTGFALPVYAIGAERNWISREKAADMTLNILQFFCVSEQSSRPDATGYKGFYYHFLDMKSGKRTWESELSTIDTALLIAGVIFARQYFNQDNDIEKEIRGIADELVNRLDWNYFVIKEDGEYKNAVSMGWRPEKGFHHMGWTGYNEALILYVLAAGGNLENTDKAYKTWLNKYEWRTPYPEQSHVVFPPMFGHQYSHMFIDFRGIQDSFMVQKEIDYFENSRRATYVQKYYAIDNPLGWKGYDSLCWGLTACDGPGEKYNYNGKKFLSYAGRGTSGPDLVYFDDGTIAPTAAAGSIPFAPEITIPALMNIHKRYSPEGLWGPYGFYDSFNPTLEWVNSDYIGIDQGPIVIMIENFRSGFVWNYFMKDPVVQEGLARLGFISME